jgi:hypothetical protein
MKIKRIDKYNRHGCRFTGNLAMIDLGEEVKREPAWGQFGGSAWASVSEKAKALMRETHPHHIVLLTIPDLVVALEAE